MTRLPKLKISWRRGKQYASPVTLGEAYKRAEEKRELKMRVGEKRRK